MDATVSAAPDGSFVVVWSSAGQDGDQAGVYAQRFGSDGVRLGVETRVNEFTTGDQRTPVSSSLQDGGSIVAWHSENQDGSGNGIYARRLDRLGVPIGGEYRVNSYLPDDQDAPSIAANRYGSYVVAWTSFSQDAPGDGVFAQRYNVLPSVVDPQQLNTPASRTISFSEPMIESGEASVLDAANWELERDGLRVVDPFHSITQSVDPTTHLAHVLLEFAEPLTPGEYTLTAKATITDLAGGHLDGNYDGLPGDDYVERFTVVPTPVAIGNPRTPVVVGDVVSPDVAVAVNSIDSTYVTVWEARGDSGDHLDIYFKDMTKMAYL